MMTYKRDMAQTEAKEWILRQNLDSLDIPNASVKEIHRMVFAHDQH